MHELAQVIPNEDVLLSLEPEELGAKLLFLLRKRTFTQDMFLPANLTAELWPFGLLPGQRPPYSARKRVAIEAALAEAWAWLEAQGLIVADADTNGRNGWKILSRR